MWLSELALVNFRNFTSLQLQPQPGVLVFCGRNGQGKTNLLESVYVLATTRSPRTSNERELVSWRAPDDPALAAVINPFARLDARVRRSEAEIHLEVTFEAERAAAPTPRRHRGGQPDHQSEWSAHPGPTGLVGQLPVVYFSPADVELAGGPPAGRRQYLNMANSQSSAAHMRALQRYNRVLLQRNQTLRLVREHRQPPSALEPWTAQLIELGSTVLKQRLRMVADLEPRLAAIFRDLSGGRRHCASCTTRPRAGTTYRTSLSEIGDDFRRAPGSVARARSSRPSGSSARTATTSPSCSTTST